MKNEKETCHADDSEIYQLAELLNRIFKIGIYYQMGHAVLERASLDFLHFLKKNVTSDKTVIIRIGNESFFWNEKKLQKKKSAVRELFELFCQLGINRIEFDVSISPERLLRFVKSLLGWRAKLVRSHSFIDFNVLDLPWGIKIQQKEFLVTGREVASVSAEKGLRGNVEKIIGDLVSNGVDSTTIEQCKIFLTDFSAINEKNVVTIQDYPNITMDDIQLLLVKAVSGQYHSGVAGGEGEHEELQSIVAIFSALEKELPQKQSKDALHFLVRNLTAGVGSANEENKQYGFDKKKISSRVIPDIPPRMIKEFVQQNCVSQGILQRITQGDSREEMSVYFQLLRYDRREKTFRNFSEFLRKNIIKGLTEEEWEVLTGGTLHLMDFNEEDFRAVVLLIVAEMRYSEPDCTLEYLLRIWRKMPFKLHLSLWPVAVNEFLRVGEKKGGAHFMEMLEIISYKDYKMMVQCRPHLERLDTFKNKDVADDIFLPACRQSYTLFYFLLETSLKKEIAVRILDGLRQKSEDQFFDLVAPLLTTNKEHLEFLRRYLFEGDLEEPTLILKIAAGEILVDFFEQAGVEMADSDWLEKAIEAMADLQVRGTRKVLEKICYDKKLGVIGVWPGKIRKIARKSLKNLKRKPLSVLH
ncbi:hypothetical protein [Desulfomarina sp.]